MAGEIETPLPVAGTEYYLREITQDDASAYQAIHERLEAAGQYYALLRRFEKQDDGGEDRGAVGRRLAQRTIETRQEHPRASYRLAICDDGDRIIGYVVILLKADENDDPRSNVPPMRDSSHAFVVTVWR